MDGLATPLLQRGPFLASGADGDVYRVLGQPNLLLKVFRTEPSIAGRMLIDRLIARRSPALDQVAAWPWTWVTSEGRSALVLPFVSAAQPVHMLFDRKTWRDTFPKADWAFMIGVGQAVARAVAVVHAAGLAVVDISEKNILVRGDGSVCLIDCDSFVITGEGRRSVSGLFTAGWLAPELAPVLANEPRTANHDNFGLARLVFQLLFAGRSPLEPPPGRSPEQPERVFGYSHVNRVRADDPADVSLSDVSPVVAGYFERAFAQSAAGRPPRPSAAEWAEALGEMLRRLRTCGRVPSHRFLNTFGRACPWCRIAAAPRGSDPFRQVAGPAPVQPVASRKGRGIGSLIVVALLAIGVIAKIRNPDTPPQAQPASRPVQGPPAVVQPATGRPQASPPPKPATGPGVPRVAPAPAPAPLVPMQTVQQRAIDFAGSLSASFGSSRASDILDRSYAPEVQYFGNGTWPHWKVMREKNAIINKWPVRIYIPRPGSASVQCEPTGLRCSVNLLIDWRTSNAQGSNAGTWFSTLGLDMSGPTPMVISENGGQAGGWR